MGILCIVIQGDFLLSVWHTCVRVCQQTHEFLVGLFLVSAVCFLRKGFHCTFIQQSSITEHLVKQPDLSLHNAIGQPLLVVIGDNLLLRTTEAESISVTVGYTNIRPDVTTWSRTYRNKSLSPKLSSLTWLQMRNRFLLVTSSLWHTHVMPSERMVLMCLHSWRSLYSLA